MSTAKKSRPAGEDGAANDHTGSEIPTILHEIRRAAVMIVGYTLLVLLLTATMVVVL